MKKNSNKNRMVRKTLAEGILVFLCILAGVLFFEPALQVSAQPILPLPTEPFAGFQGTGQTEESGIEIAKSVTARIIDNVRFIIGAVAVLTIIITSIRLITAEGEEEVFNKQRQTIVYAVVGLIIVGLSGELSQILTVEKGGFIRDPSKVLQQIRIFDRSVRIILTLIKYIIGAIAVVYIVRSGLRMVTLGANEEELGKDKKNLAYGIVGLLFILLASPIVNQVFYKIDVTRYPGVEPVRPGIDVARGLGELVGFTNLVIKFVGPAAILALLAGGIMYAIAGGDEEKTAKAKKIMLWALIGIIIIFGAFGIVSTFVAGRFESI